MAAADYRVQPETVRSPGDGDNDATALRGQASPSGRRVPLDRPIANDRGATSSCPVHQDRPEQVQGDGRNAESPGTAGARMGLATRRGNETIRSIRTPSSSQADRRNRRRKLSGPAELDLASLLPSSRTTWHYRSFFRTAPCIEDVASIIADAPGSMSAAQITPPSLDLSVQLPARAAAWLTRRLSGRLNS